jgi:hypothetical protein
MKFSDMDLAERAMRKATDLFNAQLGVSTTANLEWARVINEFGGYKGAVVKLLRLMGFGQEVGGISDSTDSEVEFFPWAVVVTIDDDNGHSYEIDEPVLLVSGEDSGLEIESEDDGELDTGDCLPEKANHYRPATEEDIQKTLKALRKRGVNSREFKKLNSALKLMS